MAHIMLDLETFGTKPGSVIRSVGAVVFNPKGEGTGGEFYANVDLLSCVEAGLTIDPQTVKWWNEQTPEARKGLTYNPRQLKDAAERFNDWWKKNDGLEVWAQGSNFDPIVWAAACEAVGVEVPWRYSNARDTRTAYFVGGIDVASIPRPGVYHNALDDAKHQAYCVQLAFKAN